jgi:anti-anti-sigma regulatory factor
MRMTRRMTEVLHVQLLAFDPPLTEDDKTALEEELTEIANRAVDNRVVLDLSKIRVFGEQEVAILVATIHPFKRRGGKLVLVVNAKAAELLHRRGLDRDQTLAVVFDNIPDAAQSLEVKSREVA